MARQTGSEMVGRVEDLIFYEREGEFLVRTVPEQTTATKNAAKLFGRASSKAKILRGLLLPLLPYPRDKDMQNRLCTAMFKFLEIAATQSSGPPEDNPLTGFRFVSTSDLRTCLKFPLVISKQADGSLLVEIPEIRPTDDMVVPRQTSRIELKLMAAALDMQNDQSSAGQPVLVEIAYNDSLLPGKNVVLETGAVDNGVVIAVAALSYFEGNIRIIEAGFEAVEIVEV